VENSEAESEKSRAGAKESNDLTLMTDRAQTF
jgi:hypothetical protein